MHLFYVTADTDMRRERTSDGRLGSWSAVGHLEEASVDRPAGTDVGHDIVQRYRLAAPSSNTLRLNCTYLATKAEIQNLSVALHRAGDPAELKVLTDHSANALLGRMPTPRRLGYIRSLGQPFVSLDEQLAAVQLPPSCLRLAIINVFHIGFGDTLVFLASLRVVRAHLERRFDHVVIEMLQATYNPEVEHLYLECDAVDAVRQLPMSLVTFGEYDGYFDLSVEYVDEAVSWIDGMLSALGLDATDIPASMKRPRIDRRPEEHADVAGEIVSARSRGQPILLFHPRASTGIRSMPNDSIPMVLDALIKRTQWTVVSAIPSQYEHPRYLDWSALSTSFQDFVYLVSQVDAFLSVDTSVYHVAAALNIPGVAMFTSILPERRTKYYPFVEGLFLGAKGRLLGMHSSERPEDIAYARRLWEDFDIERLMAALQRVVQRHREFSFNPGAVSSSKCDT